jgi:hypothetical protein
VCIIIQRPVGVTIPEWRLEAAMRQNPDGWGLMWAEEGRVRHLKGVAMADFLPAYRDLGDYSLGIHFRWRTHGKYDAVNAHPYEVLNVEQHGDDLMLMHNGVFMVPETNAAMSDTWHWIEEIRPFLEDDISLINTPEFWTILKDDLVGSRLLLLDSSGQFLRIGDWKEFEGCHYSNNSFVRYEGSSAGRTTPFGGMHYASWRDNSHQPSLLESSGPYESEYETSDDYGARTHDRTPAMPKTAGGGQVVPRKPMEDDYDEREEYFEFLDIETVPDKLTLAYLHSLSPLQLTELMEYKTDEVSEIIYDMLHFEDPD